MDSDDSILIIDDTPDTIRLISSILKDRYHVRVARSGQRGIELALQNKPGIILLDVEMPEMDGLETLSALKKSNSNVRCGHPCIKICYMSRQLYTF